MKNQKNRSVGSLFNLGVKYLSYRPRSRQEITDYLARKTDQIQDIEATISQLDEMGLVDDKAFCEWLTTSRLSYKLKGPRVIGMELRKFGVDKELIKETLNAIEPEAQLKAMQVLLAKKDRTFAKAESDFEARAKAYNYLYSRGFESSLIQTAIDENRSGQ